jgi:hypothetical protein
MKINETVNLMQSEDYKERFVAEYVQTKARYEKLHRTIVKEDAGVLSFDLTCNVALLKEQASYMGHYLYVLEVRAEKENIMLPSVEV